MWVLKGRQQREPCAAEAAKAGQLHMAVPAQALTGLARLDHAHANCALDRNAQDAEEAERARSCTLDTLGTEHAPTDDDRGIAWWLVATERQKGLHGVTVAGLARGADPTGEVSAAGGVRGPVHGAELLDRDAV